MCHRKKVYDYTMGPFIIIRKISVWREIRAEQIIRIVVRRVESVFIVWSQIIYTQNINNRLIRGRRVFLRGVVLKNFFNHKTSTCNNDFLPFPTDFWFPGLLFFLRKRSIVLQNDRYTKRRGRNRQHCTDGSGAWYSVFCYITQSWYLSKERKLFTRLRDMLA